MSAASTISRLAVGDADDQPGRRHRAHSDGDGAGRSRERRSAVRIARRHGHPVSVPARRRLQHQGGAEAAAVSLSDRHGRAAPDRRPSRRRAAEAVHDRRRGQGTDRARELCRQHAGRSAVGSLHAHRGRRPDRARAGDGRHASRRRVVRAAGTGSPKASCSRRSAASRARPTSCTSATRRSTAWRSPARSSRARRRTRRAAAGVHLPSGRARRQRSRARGAFCRRSRGARIAARSATAISTTLLAFYRAGRAEERIRRRHPARAAAHPRLAALSLPHRARAADDRGRSAPYRVSDLDLASRLSFFLWSSIPDDELLAAATRGTLSDRADAGAAGAPDAGRSPLAGAGGQLREPVAHARQAVRRRARRRCVSRVRREPARRVPPGDAAVRRHPAARGPQRRRAGDRQLLLRQRAAGAALPDPERLRQPLQARDVHRRRARRTARAGQHPDGDVVSEPHVAGAARPLAARQRARRAAAAAAARRPAAERGRRRPQDRCRSASRWRRTARIRRAPCATCGWIRSGSRSRTSTRSASGARRATASPIDASARCRTARGSRASPACGSWSPSHQEDFARTFTQKLLAYALGRSLEARDHAGRAPDRARRRGRAAIAGRRSSLASRRARRSR